MHTATQISEEMFRCSVDDVSVAPLEALGEFDTSSRLGVVVTDAYGAVGASLLIQLYILGFYEVKSERRQGEATYPEIYLFHFGGQFGSHSAFDFWPQRREIVIPAEPDELLASLNSHAITHVLIPEGPLGIESGWGYTDPGAAYDRIQSCYIYSPQGRVRDGCSLSIQALDAALMENTESTLDPQAHINWIEASLDGYSDATTEEYLRLQKTRLGEVTEEQRHAMKEARNQIAIDGLPLETYAEISIKDCLARISGLAD